MSLIDEIKRRRVKRAAYGELGLRAASELGEEAVERVTAQKGGDAPVRLPAMHIRPVVEERISDFVTEMVKRRRIPPDQATTMSKRLMEEAEPEIRKAESAAYRTESGVQVLAPSTLTSAAGATAFMTAVPWLVSRSSWLAGKRPKNPMSLGRSFKEIFLPGFLPVTVGFEALSHLLSPMRDPQRQRKDRGYWKSVAESYRGAQQGLAEQGAEVRARYGPLGLPFQMFHGIMNPLASLGYLGRQLGGAFRKPDIEEWAQEAAARRKEMLGQS